MATVLGLQLLAVVLACLCCWPCCLLQNVVATTNLSSTCHKYYDHCHAHASDEKAYGIGLQTSGKLSPAIPRERLNSRDYFNSLCFCDEQCRLYGDCCPDAVTDEVRSIEAQNVGGTGRGQRTVNRSAVRWECLRISRDKFMDSGIYAIGSCPSEYPHNGIHQRCKRSIAEDNYGYYLDIPVISIRTNLTYANIYCAVCHNDNQVHKWSISIDCPFANQNCINNLTLWKYLPGERQWKYNEDIITYEILIKDSKSTHILEDYAKSGARKCRLDIVDTCPSSWSGAKEHQLCAAYAFYVQLLNNSTVYKNEHCAKCHHWWVLQEHLQCPEMVTRYFKHDRHGSLSYSILIDFDNFLGKVGESQFCGKIKCKLGEFCEPLHHVCSPYTCGSNYEMDPNGQCIEHLTSSMNITNGTAKNIVPACPMNYIHMDEFVWQPNNSIYVNATGRTFTLGEFEVVNATTVLVCIDNSDMNFRKFSTSQGILSTVCITCSLVCLAIHIVVHAVLPQMHNLPGRNLLCLSASLFVAQFLFEFGFQAYSSYEVCMSIAIIVHYCFLASFFWMNIMAIDVCRTFAQRSTRPWTHRKFWKYSTYAWLTPFLIVVLAISNNAFAFLPQFDPMYGEPLCWINNRQALFLFFAAPLAVLLLENLFLYVLTIVGIQQASKMGQFARQCSSTSRDSDQTRFLLYAKLAVIMGLTWLTGFVAAFANVDPLWYLFIILNASQGVFIFLAFTCKRKVYSMLKSRFCHHPVVIIASDGSDSPSSLTKDCGLLNTDLTNLSNPPPSSLTTSDQTQTDFSSVILDSSKPAFNPR